MAGLWKLITTGFNSNNYYSSMNEALKKINNRYTMLHYPYFVNESDDFHTTQKNLTDFCLSNISDFQGKRILEIGCGNGIQSIYIKDKYMPAYIKGIDLNKSNIEIARREKHLSGLDNIEFEVGDAQKLESIPDNSFDIVINIESAFHYPNKQAFLNEVERVLKPGGSFIVADIIRRNSRKIWIYRWWKNKMHMNHWEKDTYEKGFLEANLSVLNTIDITEKVIKGFKQLKLLYKTVDKKNLIHDSLLKIFYSINILLNIYLLKKSKYYFVYAGISEKKKLLH